MCDERNEREGFGAIGWIVFSAVVWAVVIIVFVKLKQ